MLEISDRTAHLENNMQEQMICNLKSNNYCLNAYKYNNMNCKQAQYRSFVSFTGIIEFVPLHVSVVVIPAIPVVVLIVGHLGSCLLEKQMLGGCSKKLNIKRRRNESNVLDNIIKPLWKLMLVLFLLPSFLYMSLINTKKAQKCITKQVIAARQRGNNMTGQKLEIIQRAAALTPRKHRA